VTAAAQPPPWVWDQLPDELYAESWRRLADWVEWLERAYAPWVVLPVCWPAHEGLRTELTVFWVWHRWFTTAAVNPVDGVRWHSELRRAAQDWRALANCLHDPPPYNREQQDAARRAERDRFIAEASARR
jgi:hypothetical protein